MRITQIITILLSVALLALAGWLAVSPPEPHLAVQAQFEEAAAPTTPVTPEPTTPAPTAPAEPKPLTGPAAFTISNLAAPEIINPFTPVTVSFKVTNTGAEQGTYKAVLKVASREAGFEKTETRDVTLAGGASQTVTLDVTTGPAGIYIISVGDLTKNMRVEIQQEA